MPLAARDTGGALRTIVGLKVRDPANVLQSVSVARVRDPGGASRIFFNPFSMTVIPYTVFKTQGTFTFPLTITTGLGEAFPAGAVAPITYAWARYSGDIGITPTAPAGKATAFQATFNATDTEASAVFQVTATDATGAKATALCSVRLVCVNYN